MQMEYALTVGLKSAVLGDIKVADVVAEVAATLSAFSVSHGTGYWAGQQEPNVTVTLVSDEYSSTVMRILAERLAEKFKQEAVMFTVKPVTVEFITARTELSHDI